MRISDIVRSKGDNVVTIAPTATVSELLALLAEHRIGAVVVSADGEHLDGIVSERDVVRHLNDRGAEVLGGEVSRIMTELLHTCAPGDDLVVVATTMTEQRVRHLPIVVDGRLAGIVSIGDVVKKRMDELAAERDQLTAYIQQ
ncbi:CBS domain-containing protein [Kribbia dieselivorans]|uniref:CBS domain-containing protein n=1 Tax=Kribbia dieselivorans TaxID=331526 RepID=UPI000838AA79|nr:CBS domain-containing protein [Kribbia dieselivorans]